VVEAAVAVEWSPVEEVETSLVTVVEEGEPRNDARRHGAEEAYSLRAPLVESEKVAAVEASDGAVPPARARCGTGGGA
jgi:chemotaxis regulatin CheY-phosphate phosphatase CheZ